ncbi:AbrB/MazE/SpoVT family DNA-binding domain-containing protein (plasmid) [Methanocaldococcus sp. 16A]
MKVYAVRKIQRRTWKHDDTCYETYFINLPKDWMEEVGVSKGDEVVLIKGKHGELIIKPQKSEEENMTTG